MHVISSQTRYLDLVECFPIEISIENDCINQKYLDDFK